MKRAGGGIWLGGALQWHGVKPRRHSQWHHGSHCSVVMVTVIKFSWGTRCDPEVPWNVLLVCIWRWYNIEKRGRRCCFNESLIFIQIFHLHDSLSLAFEFLRKCHVEWRFQIFFRWTFADQIYGFWVFSKLSVFSVLFDFVFDFFYFICNVLIFLEGHSTSLPASD